MNREDWLINEVDKWQDDNIIDTEAGNKIKKQYEIYRKYNPNVFTILFAILGALLITAGIGLICFYNWRTLPKFAKVIVAIAPLVISYVISIFTVLFKGENKVWRESSAFLNTISLFFALGIVINEFHFDMSLSQYLLVGSLLTLPMIYIMQAVSPLVIYYTAIILWANLNIALGNAPILLGLYLLGTGVIGFNITKLNKTFRYNACISAIAGLPFIVMFSRMLNGDGILAAFLYSTIIFAARDLKRGQLHFKLISTFVSMLTIIYVTIAQAWVSYNVDFGGIPLGILTAIILLGSLALEVFNTKENNYEFSYLLVLMGASIIRYVWGCIHTNALVAQLIFMSLSIIIALLVAIGFVALGKSKKKMDISAIGFGLIGLLVLIKIFEYNLFFLWRAVAFLVLGSASLILVIFLAKPAEKVEEDKIEENIEENTEEASDEESEEETVEEQDTNDGGDENEEDNTAN